MCAGKFPLVSMGGRAEGLACADPGVRTPIGASGNYTKVSFLIKISESSIISYLFYIMTNLLCLSFSVVLGTNNEKREDVSILHLFLFSDKKTTRRKAIISNITGLCSHV